MNIGEICSGHTHRVDADETVQHAATHMQKENVGTLLVLGEDHRPIGILTDRDLAIRVVAAGMDPRRTQVREVMTSHPHCVGEAAPIEDAVAAMRSLGIRRLPVVDADGRLTGVISVDDVLELVTEELRNLGSIVGWSQPGATLPAESGSVRRRQATAAAGLQRVGSDVEC